MCLKRLKMLIRQKEHVILDKKIVQDSRMTIESIGVYVKVEVGDMKIEEIPEKIARILLEVGYLYKQYNGGYHE